MKWLIGFLNLYKGPNVPGTLFASLVSCVFAFSVSGCSSYQGNAELGGKTQAKKSEETLEAKVSINDGSQTSCDDLITQEQIDTFLRSTELKSIGGIEGRDRVFCLTETDGSANHRIEGFLNVSVWPSFRIKNKLGVESHLVKTQPPWIFSIELESDDISLSDFAGIREALRAKDGRSPKVDLAVPEFAAAMTSAIGLWSLKVELNESGVARKLTLPYYVTRTKDREKEEQMGSPLDPGAFAAGSIPLDLYHLRTESGSQSLYLAEVRPGQSVRFVSMRSVQPLEFLTASYDKLPEDQSKSFCSWRINCPTYKWLKVLNEFWPKLSMSAEMARERWQKKGQELLARGGCDQYYYAFVFFQRLEFPECAQYRKIYEEEDLSLRAISEYDFTRVLKERMQARDDFDKLSSDKKQGLLRLKNILEKSGYYATASDNKRGSLEMVAFNLWNEADSEAGNALKLTDARLADLERFFSWLTVENTQLSDNGLTPLTLSNVSLALVTSPSNLNAGSFSSFRELYQSLKKRYSPEESFVLASNLFSLNNKNCIAPYSSIATWLVEKEITPFFLEEAKYLTEGFYGCKNVEKFESLKIAYDALTGLEGDNQRYELAKRLVFLNFSVDSIRKLDSKVRESVFDRSPSAFDYVNLETEIASQTHASTKVHGTESESEP